MQHERSSELIAVASATALHVAVGLALFAAARPGLGVSHDPFRAGERLVTVHLVSPEVVSPAPAPSARAPARAELAPARTEPESESSAAAMRPVADPAVPASGATAADAAPVPLAVNPGANMSYGDVQFYRALLQAHLLKFRNYPLEARRDRVEGTVFVHFVIDRSGQVARVWIDSSSGSRILDREAVGAISRARPLPPLPRDWPALIDVSLPMEFTLG